jgi:hypothetical protein
LAVQAHALRACPSNIQGFFGLPFPFVPLWVRVAVRMTAYRRVMGESATTNGAVRRVCPDGESEIDKE